MGRVRCADRGARIAIEDEELAWVARAKAGDSDAFAAIYRRYRVRIQAYCYGVIGDATDAEDLTQQTFLKAYNALPRTTADLALNAWLYRIAANACTDLLRRRRTARAQPWDVRHHDRPSPRREDEPEAAALDADSRRAIHAALAAISPRHREALLLRVQAERPLAEIERTLNLSTPALKSLLYRARREFEKRYRP
ncbi:MAG: RNA polymerase sigma factor [Thermomicrobiales bacterium]